MLAHFVMKGETPRKTRGSLIGMVNEREFGVSYLEANITDNEEGSSTLQARLDNIPPSIGEWVQNASGFMSLYCSMQFVDYTSRKR